MMLCGSARSPRNTRLSGRPFELLAGQLHAGHPPGVLHAGEVGTDLLGELDGDAVVAVGRDLHAEGGLKVGAGQLGRALEAAAGQQDATRGTHGVLDPVGADDDAAHPRLVRQEADRGSLDADVHAVAQARLQQRADQSRTGEPRLVDADTAEHPERQRVLRHARGQGRADVLRCLAEALRGVRAGEQRPTDGRAVDVGAVVRPDRRDPAEPGVRLDVTGDVGAGLQELLDQRVVEDSSRPWP